MDPLSLQRYLSPVLTPFGVAYGYALATRRAVWESGCLPRLAPTCPCVSVGNISWGGTGKTPIVDWLLSWADANGKKAVTLSRGYKATPPVLPLRVTSDNTPAEAGDEPLMLALRHPRAVVLVDPKRKRSGTLALGALHPDCLILDDGFQHLPIKRHVDLVLLRPEDLTTQWNKVIPAGSWRENASALCRASAFLIKATPEAFHALEPDLVRRLELLGKPAFSFTLQPKALRRLDVPDDALEMPATAVDGNYVFVSGIGNPEQAVRTVTAFMGRAPYKHLAFPDHYAYPPEETRELSTLGLPIICTEKDAVKVRALCLRNVWSLRVEVCFGPALWSQDDFSAWWGKQYARIAG